MLTRAATENRTLASALGVNERLLFTAVFALGAFLAGLAGALQLPREPANLGMDLAIIAEAFVVTVVGGLGSIPGAFVAALLIGLTKALCIALGTVEVGGYAIAFPKLTLVAEFVVMAVVLVAKPYGLMGAAPARAADDAARRIPRAGRAARPPRRDRRAGRARAGRAAAVDRRRVSPGPRDRHPRVHAVRREPAARDGHRRHGLVRPRRVFRPRGLRRRAGGAKHGMPMEAALLLAPLAALAGALVDRLVLRPALRRLHGDADARVRADRLVDRVPVGCRHRRLQRDRRRLAVRMARRQAGLLLVRAAADRGARWRRSRGSRTRRSAIRCAPAAIRRCGPRPSASTSGGRSGRPSRSRAASRASPAGSTRSPRAAFRRRRWRFRARSTRW